MRKIPIVRWTAKSPSGVEQQESTLTALTSMIGGTRPEDMPRGLENFRLFQRLLKAFEEAEVSGILSLEEADYATLKRMLDNVPAIWAMHKDLAKAIEGIANAEEVK